MESPMVPYGLSGFSCGGFFFFFFFSFLLLFLGLVLVFQNFRPWNLLDRKVGM